MHCRGATAPRLPARDPVTGITPHPISSSGYGNLPIRSRRPPVMLRRLTDARRGPRARSTYSARSSSGQTQAWQAGDPRRLVIANPLYQASLIVFYATALSSAEALGVFPRCGDLAPATASTWSFVATGPRTPEGRATRRMKFSRPGREYASGGHASVGECSRWLPACLLCVIVIACRVSGWRDFPQAFDDHYASSLRR